MAAATKQRNMYLSVGCYFFICYQPRPNNEALWDLLGIGHPKQQRTCLELFGFGRMRGRCGGTRSSFGEEGGSPPTTPVQTKTRLSTTFSVFCPAYLAIQLSDSEILSCK